MRWILRIALTLLTLVVVAVAALFLLPTDRIARIAEEKFFENTGRTLTLSGDVSPVLFPRLGVTLSGVSIENAAWSERGPMVQADRMELGVGLMALIGGEIVVEAFNIENPTIRLEKNAEGRENWEFIADMGGGADDGGETPDVSLPKATITGGTVEYVDAASGQSYRLEALSADLALADLAGDGVLEMTAELQGQPFTLAGTINGVQQLLDGGVQGVDLTLSVSSNAVSFQGSAGMEPIQAQGALNAQIRDQNALFALLDQSPPVIPEGLGQQVTAQGALTYTADNRIFLREAVIDLDQNRLTGDLDLNLGGDKPIMTAKLAGDSLDFSAMSTDETEGDGAANAGAGGWSDARLDISGLSAVDGQVAFTANAVDLGSILLGPTQMNASIENSRMVVDLGEVTAFDGQIAGQFVVNGRGGVSVRGDMTARGVAMQKLLDDFAGFDRLIGDAALDLEFLGSGATLNEIMNSLNGSGALDVGAGELLGLDIAGMIKNLDLAFEGEGSKTVFDDITATFSITDGVLANNDLNFVASLLTATGDGTMDLGGQTINYRLDPLALSEQISGGIRVPVLITGPWSDIKFRPDLKALIDTELEAAKAELEAAAKAKEAELKAAAEAKEAELKAQAAAKLQEELGVTAEEGVSVEETVKDGLEEKAKNALRGLLGGN